MRPVDIIAIPSDLGNYRCGAREGPDALKRFGLPLILQEHDITSRWYDIAQELGRPELFDSEKPSRAKAQHLAKIREIGKLARMRVHRAHHLDRVPVIIGGDNAYTMDTAGETIKHALLTGKRAGLLYIDAHLDVHTPDTSHTGHVHGMPLSAILGVGSLAEKRSIKVYDQWHMGGKTVSAALPPDKLIHIGMGESDVESEELALFDRLHIASFPMWRLRNRHGWNDLYRAINELAVEVDILIVVVDLDVFHEDIAPAVTYRSKGGISAADWRQLCDHIAATGKVGHIEIMEYNPSKESLDHFGKPRTAVLVTGVLLHLLGVYMK
jgi:arginase